MADCIHKYEVHASSTSRTETTRDTNIPIIFQKEPYQYSDGDRIESNSMKDKELVLLGVKFNQNRRKTTNRDRHTPEDIALGQSQSRIVSIVYL